MAGGPSQRWHRALRAAWRLSLTTAKMVLVKIVPRTIAGLLGAIALGLASSACSNPANVPAGTMAVAIPPGPHPTPTTVVVLQNFSFNPSVVTIKPGQTVEWIWRDKGAPHNVTFSNFHSATITAGAYYHTFDTPGTYYYICTLHYNMTGEVIVTGT